MLVSELGNCIYRCRRHLAAFVALSILLCSIFVNFKQTYTAETYIKYLGENAIYGNAVDGSHLNPYEIKNSLVVKKALLELNIEDINHEEVRRNITVTPVYSTDEEEMHESWIENFSTYDETEENRDAPIYYSIKFETDRGAKFADRFLNALVEEYRAYYVEKHAYNNNVMPIPEKAVMQFDYFETADILKSKVKSNIEYLQAIESSDFNYRSPETGYSLSDLENKYKTLLEKDIASVSNEILERGLVKNVPLLKASLKTKSENAILSSDREASKALSHKELMQTYSNKNKEYTWGTSEDETNQVREDTERDRIYNREEMTYDKLMLEYVEYAANSKDLIIDSNNYDAHISYFGEENKIDSAMDKKLSEICAEYNELYELTQTTLDDYNNYKAAHYISHISGICAEESMGEVIYYTATIIIALGLGILVIIFNDLSRKRKI